MRRGSYVLISAAVLAVALLGAAARAADWPMWRYDAARSAASPEDLPADLHLQWVRQFEPPTPAWPETQTKLQFDASYEPVVMGKRLFVASMASDRVTAYDTETGAEQWRFYTDGPVRLPPVAWEGKVAVASDDGHLYCVDAESGRLAWKFRGGPADRRLLGNDRLISTWPARGGPVYCDGMVYFAAGMWPFMGIFVHALDAETGRVVWTNSGSGSNYLLQQHEKAYAFAGVAPQGCLAVAGERLLVAGGRTVPAAYDLATGEFRYFKVGEKEFGKEAGGHEVFAAGKWFFNGGVMYKTEDGSGVLRHRGWVADPGALIGFDRGEIVGYELWPSVRDVFDRRGNKRKEDYLPDLWRAAPDVPLRRVFIKAGSRLYAEGRDGLVAAVDLPVEGGRARVSWQDHVEGEVWDMLAADGRLFVVTALGRLYCFGEKVAEPVVHRYEREPLAPEADRWTTQAETILEETQVTRGYCLVVGLTSGRLVEELVRRSGLYVIAVDKDERKVASLRRRLDAAGLYGSRAAVYAGDPATFPFPPYLASLVVSEDLESAGFGRGADFLRAIFATLRPYGGMFRFEAPADESRDFARRVLDARLAGASVEHEDGATYLVREGPLAGSADWTHQYADVANTAVSKDSRVRLPLGLLWFGGPANDDVLPRHGHGPTPQVIDGRLFIEGRDMLRAVDAYTGRLLWEREFKDLGLYYDNTSHQPGSNEVGSNYASAPDGIYVAEGRGCVRIDPRTGATLAWIELPSDGALRGARWGYVGLYKDLLLATALPLDVELTKGGKVTLSDDDLDKEEKDGKDEKGEKDEKDNEDDDRLEDIAVHWNAPQGASSKHLLVLDRYSGYDGTDAGKGKVLWRRQADAGFRHNAIVAGADKVFCIDGLSDARVQALKFRGLKPSTSAKLLALEARTGKVVWRADKDVSGTWLGYSEERDILLAAGSRARDRALDESGEGLVAYRGRDGKRLWAANEVYRGPCMIHGDTIITQTEAFSLLTGEPVTRAHPLTGETMPWTYTRTHGCNTSIGSRNLILFRSGAAGYYDLEHDGGTGNLGGFKSGCTSNLIVAGGILSAPDFTRTCTCSYQNQCSVAFVHDPSVEVWTFNALAAKQGTILRVGLNFGAPGDRMADDGTLWLDWPSVGGTSPQVWVKARPERPKTFRYHMSSIESGALRWVAASGIEDVESLTIGLVDEMDGPHAYAVRLHFAEPADLEPGDRVFSVSLQGDEVLRDFDIVREAGGPRRAVVKEFKGIEVDGDLMIDFTATVGKTLLCGIEIVAD